jgi:magnesium transporter
MSNRRKKLGTPPGTVEYYGKERTERVKLTLIQYNIHNAALIEGIGKLFHIHPLTLEDIVSTHQRAKFEDYESYVVAMMKMLYYDVKMESEQLCVVLQEGIVISFQEPRGGDAFDLIRNRLRQGKGRIRKMGADYLAYALVDAVVDCYFSILEKIGDNIEVLEEELINNPTKNTMEKLHNMKREMIFVRKAIWPMRDLINNMERSETPLIKPTTDVYLRDVHDHAIRVIDTVESYRDLLSGMMDIYLSSVSNKMNEVMKVLTIITTLFVPVTFIAGVYGMNFKYMPELESPWGYPVTWAVMLTVMISLLVYFKKKKWM